MDLDKLIKLVKLANNNPNENEANLAARKVCKIIEEGKFQFNNTKPNPPVSKSQRGGTYNDIYRQDTWGGFDATWRPSPSQSQKEYYARTARAQNEANDKRRKEEYEAELRKRKEKEHKDTVNYAYYNTDGSDPDAYNNPKRKLTCMVCGEEKETRFRGPSQVWTCMDCRGKENFK